MLDARTLRRLWPHAPQVLVDAVAAKAAAAFARHGLTTPLRVAHFMAQISHESGGGTVLEENLNYTTAAQIERTWPKRFTVAEAAAYTHNPRKLADKVYGGRMGNRPGTDDGFNYRGGGILQLTGRDSYRQIGPLVGLPLEERPELARAPTAVLEIAAAEFVKLGCLPWCDKDNVEAVTRRVNGGFNGLAQRKEWLARWKAALRAQYTPAVEEPDPAPAEPEPVPLPPERPEIPRGSDDRLPPDVDEPGKTMADSRTGWAAVIGTFTAIASTVGQAVDAIRPVLEDPRTIILVAAVVAATGVFIWFDRRKRLRQDHV